jgi:hypothetical protein
MPQKSNGTSKPRATPPPPKRKEMFSPEEKKILKSILDQKPPIVDLPVASLQADMSYQERPRERIVDQVASGLSEALLNVLIVAQRPDGTYWVIDGESRRQGILRRGEKQRVVPCQVFQTEGPKQEALLFQFFNSKRSKEPIKLANSLIALGVAGVDRGFVKAIEECGFKLGKGTRQLRGPGYVKRAWELDGDGTAMRKALYTLKDSWREKYQIHGYMVLGVARLYHHIPRSIDDQVRRVLKAKSPDAIMDLVERRYASVGGKRPRIHPDDKPKLVERVIADLINKNPGAAGKIDLAKLDDARIGA